MCGLVVTLRVRPRPTTRPWRWLLVQARDTAIDATPMEFSWRWRKRQLWRHFHEKAPSSMRTYNTCRFSSMLSAADRLTWTPPLSSHRFVGPFLSPVCHSLDDTFEPGGVLM